ncbi:MAG: hypothetical protein WC236_15145 [Gallionellaceae bacterium]|jgi:hypothetical protein
MSQHDLKHLQVRKAKLESELADADLAKRESAKKYSELSNKIGAINKEIAALSPTEIIISEHALLRYLERAMGFDLAEISKSILSEANKTAIKKMGSGVYPVAGLQMVVKDNVLVTVK